MTQKENLKAWEKLVESQLKTSNIYEILGATKDGVALKPYLTENAGEISSLPMVEESSQLVANYRDGLEEDVFAFLLDKNIEGLEDKALYINDKSLAGHILTEQNRVFSLVGLMDINTGELDIQLAKELLAKQYERSLTIDLSTYQNGGASIIQQLAYGISIAKEIVEELGETALHDIIFKIAIGSNYFMEIAKIRALKLLFVALCKEYNVEVKVPYIFAETTLRNKTNFDKENNLIRSTLELASGMVGGADALYSNNYALENSTPLSEEISFKQQIILAYESILNVFTDASNGSYYVEDITQQLCEKAWDLFLGIEDEGGIIKLTQEGKIQKEVFASATMEHEELLNGNISLIGANLYPKLEVKKSLDELYTQKEIKPVRLSEVYE